MDKVYSGVNMNKYQCGTCKRLNSDDGVAACDIREEWISEDIWNWINVVGCASHSDLHYQCGDECKGECSGEVDGTFDCPVSSQNQNKCYDGTECIDGKSDACNICYIPLQKGEKVSCKLPPICKFTKPECFTYNPEYKCDFDTRLYYNDFQNQKRLWCGNCGFKESETCNDETTWKRCRLMSSEPEGKNVEDRLELARNSAMEKVLDKLEQLLCAHHKYVGSYRVIIGTNEEIYDELFDAMQELRKNGVNK